MTAGENMADHVWYRCIKIITNQEDVQVGKRKRGRDEEGRGGWEGWGRMRRGEEDVQVGNQRGRDEEGARRMGRMGKDGGRMGKDGEGWGRMGRMEKGSWGRIWKGKGFKRKQASGLNFKFRNTLR
jgi:hypothetical protein